MLLMPPFKEATSQNQTAAGQEEAILKEEDGKRTPEDEEQENGGQSTSSSPPQLTPVKTSLADGQHIPEEAVQDEMMDTSEKAEIGRRAETDSGNGSEEPTDVETQPPKLTPNGSSSGQSTSSSPPQLTPVKKPLATNGQQIPVEAIQDETMDTSENAENRRSAGTDSGNGSEEPTDVENQPPKLTKTPFLVAPDLFDHVSDGDTDEIFDGSDSCSDYDDEEESDSEVNPLMDARNFMTDEEFELQFGSAAVEPVEPVVVNPLIRPGFERRRSITRSPEVPLDLSQAATSSSSSAFALPAPPPPPTETPLHNNRQVFVDYSCLNRGNSSVFFEPIGWLSLKIQITKDITTITDVPVIYREHFINFGPPNAHLLGTSEQYRETPAPPPVRCQKIDLEDVWSQKPTSHTFYEPKLDKLVNYAMRLLTANRNRSLLRPQVVPQPMKFEVYNEGGATSSTIAIKRAYVDEVQENGGFGMERAETPGPMERPKRRVMEDMSNSANEDVPLIQPVNFARSETPGPSKRQTTKSSEEILNELIAPVIFRRPELPKPKMTAFQKLKTSGIGIGGKFGPLPNTSGARLQRNRMKKGDSISAPLRKRVLPPQPEKKMVKRKLTFE